MQTEIPSALATTVKVQIGNGSCNSPLLGEAVRSYAAQRMYAVRLFPLVALAFTRVPSCVQHLVDADSRSVHAVAVETALAIS